FGENQLYPCSIGISPLPTPHPRIFQHTWVRASCQCYLTFTLDMGRSHGFGSTTAYSMRPFQTRFRLGSVVLPLNLAYDRNSPVHSAKGTPSPINGLRLLVGTRFQALFHSPSGVLFTFPSRYWFTIGHQGVFSLVRWSSLIPTACHVFPRILYPLGRTFSFDSRPLTIYFLPFLVTSS